MFWLIRDYERVERVLDENPSSGNSYYVLSFNEKPSDKTVLTFKPSNCPSGQVLKVKCKNLECGIRTQAPSQARYTRVFPLNQFFIRLLYRRKKSSYVRLRRSLNSKYVFFVRKSCLRDSTLSLDYSLKRIARFSTFQDRRGRQFIGRKLAVASSTLQGRWLSMRRSPYQWQMDSLCGPLLLSVYALTISPFTYRDLLTNREPEVVATFFNEIIKWISTRRFVFIQASCKSKRCLRTI